ncbi:MULTISPECIES: prolipoprotein diacylglyceryl transferase [Methylosinus]|uniref:Phosphatidylglycerol--prolipoprotein diacylglyceryl transferase n=1 Tax=Methylosinus trichosporium (strain ATCC 35070 / NCIMB 11131 / UNIQEM 75 / OB3b) TaxID=595536 RepID=A0A2D2D0Q9_METT3|nr:MULTISPECIES: prolipoprotein diacylglyceryl transferase [Methylosinus]ATQ68552.1 prolipoprotein diacylglyceryl transferase [Methylosinus trichosporium OB3b]OBS52794.1 prolipoprotein diacylglyceryl transferase [Methylosinus sp. 3S-1]
MLVLPFPVVDPVLIEIGPMPIRWYALAYIAGLALGWAYARRLVAADALWGGTPRPSPASLDDLLAFVAIGVIIGGRLGHVFFYERAFYLAHPEEIVKTWKGGMAFHGGLIGAMLGMTAFALREKLSALTVSDICATVAPLGIFFGRLANFIKPEMWGRPSDVPWAMVFPGAGDVARHPSQLYEAGLEGLALLLLLAFAARRGALKRPGLATGLFGVGYGLARIVSEFFREPDPVSEALGDGLTMGMALSAPMVLVGAALVAFALRARRVPA